MLFLVLFLLSLIGIELFRNKIKINKYSFYSKQFDFNSFFSAFSVCFNLINLNNWYDMVIIGFKSSNPIAYIIFTLTLIFFGNFVILNLFIVIMLEGFENIDFFEKSELKEIEDELFNNLFQNIYNEEDNIEGEKKNDKFYNFVNSKQTSKGEESFDIILDDISDCEVVLDQGIFKDEKKRKNPYSKQLTLANINSIEKSIKSFRSENLHQYFFTLLKSPIFDCFINLLIFCSLVLLSIESFYSDSDKSANKYLKIFGLIINFGFTFEAIFKIIATGFIFGKNSYLRDLINIFEFIIIIVVYLREIYPTNFSFFRVFSI